MSRMLDAALAIRRAGLSFIPSYPKSRAPAWHLLPVRTRENGEPVLNLRSGKPMREWRPYMDRQPTEDEVRSWFGNGRLNLAVVCGAVSGNLQVLDFDYDADETFPQWNDSVDQDVLERLTIIQTGKGFHVYFRVPDYTEMPPNKVLAKKPGDKPKSYKVLIELLSEGSLCTTAPSYHAGAGRHYRAIQGSLLSIPDLTIEEASDLVAAAMRLTRVKERTPQFNGQRVVSSTMAFAGFDQRAAEKYATGALRNLTEELARCLEGGRNHRLNETAFWLGRYIGAGFLSEAEVAAKLEDACQTNGLIPDDGMASFVATLRSGFDGGIANPMTQAELSDRLSAGSSNTNQALRAIHPPLTEAQYRQVRAVIQSVQEEELWRTFHLQMTSGERLDWTTEYHVSDHLIDRYALGMTSDSVTTVAGLSIPPGAFTVPFLDQFGNIRDIEFRNGTEYFYQVDSLPSIHYIPPFFADDEPNPEAPLILMMDSITAVLTYMKFGQDGALRFGALPHAAIRPESLRDNLLGEIYLLIGTESNTSGRGLHLLDDAGVRICRLPIDSRTLRESGFTHDDLRQILDS